MMDKLTKDTVSVPQMWRLSLEVGYKDVKVVLNTSLEDNALIYRVLPLNPAMAQLPALEDLIYENPLLLSDFSSIDLLYDTERFMIVPGAISDPDEREAMMRAIWPDESYEFVTNDIIGCDSALVMAIESPMLAFLHRTFPEASVKHSLSELASYFAPRSQQGNCGKIYANLRDGAVDVVAFSSRTPWAVPSERNTLTMRRSFLRICNTFRVDNMADAAYYILAAAQTAGFSLKSDEIILSGPKELRLEVMPKLREFASTVMPVLFPSEMFRAGEQAFKAPFQLIVPPLI